MTVKKSKLSRSEKALLLSTCVLIVIVVTLLIWYQGLETNPQVTVPIPEMPSPNAYDYYLNAGKAVVDVTLPGVSKPLTITEIYQLLRRGETPGNGPGIVATSRKPGKVPQPAQQDERQPSFAEMQTLLHVNVPALNMLRDGFQYEYREPPVRSFSQLRPHFSKYRALVTALNVQGYVKRNTGDWNGAKDAYLDAIRIGVDTLYGTDMMGMLSGTGLQRIGRADLWLILDHLDAPQAAAAAQQMEAMLARQVPFAATAQEEEWEIQASLMDIFRKSGWRTALQDWDTSDENSTQHTIRVLLTSKRQVMDNYTRYMQAGIAYANLPYAAPKTAPPLPNDPISSDLAVSFEYAYFRDAFNNTQNALLTVSFALRAYYVEHGQYPASLKELTPTYLHAIPADPFALNGTLRYKRTGTSYILYSVGPDGKDDGGQASTDGHRPPPTPRNQPRRPAQITREGSKGDMVAGVNVN